MRSRIIGYANYRMEYGGKFGGATMFTLGMVSNSGIKLSYIYPSDFNGDGQTNDLIYGPNSASELNFAAILPNATFPAGVTAAEQQAAYDEYIEGNDYLKTRRGQYAERNGGYFPWLTRFDFSVVQEFHFKVGAKQTKNTLQVRFDILNVGNLINKGWGVAYNTTTASPISVASIDANGLPTYRLATQTKNVDGVSQTTLIKDSFVKGASINDVWQGQLGIRYIFN